MRNLKRVLSLVMMIAMVASLMIVGASAGYQDFTDKDEIVNKIAVETLVELGVISGKEDGSFYAPKDTLTRAEAAKLVCFVLNGGKEPVLSDPSYVSFGDTKGHWAAKYIEYVASLDIVAGDGTNFKPDENLTATQLAKMLLVALDYDADFEKLVGGEWNIKTDALANQKGLYDGLDNMVTSDPINRDDAAQIIYNALTAYIVKYTSANNGSNVGTKAEDTGATLLSKYFLTDEVVGIVLANDVFTVEYGGAKAPAGKMVIDITSINGGDSNLGSDTLPIDVDNALVGQEVTVFVKDRTKTDEAVLGAVVATENNKVVSTMKGYKNVDKVNSFLKDNDLSFDAGTVVVLNGVYGSVNKANAENAMLQDINASATNLGGIDRTLIDNDANGIVDYVLVTEKALSKVTDYDAADEEITLDNATTAIAFKDAVMYEGIAKKDIVLAVQYGALTYIEKAVTVTGEVTAYNATNGVTVDGTAYAPSALGNNVGALDTTLGNTMIGSSYVLYLDDAENVIAYEEAPDNEKNYALVTASNAEMDVLGSVSGTVKLLKANAEEDVYTVDLEASANKFIDGGVALSHSGGTLAKNSPAADKEKCMALLLGKGVTAATGSTDISTLTNAALKTDAANALSDLTTTAYIVTYTENEDGTVVLAPVSQGAPTNADTDNDNNDSVVNPIRKNNVYVVDSNKAMANNGTVYFFYDAVAKEFAVVTGLNSLPLISDKAADSVANVAYTEKDGAYTAEAAYVTAAVATDADYVYVIADSETTLANNVYQYEVAMVGSEEVHLVQVKTQTAQVGIQKLGTSGSYDKLTEDADGTDDIYNAYVITGKNNAGLIASPTANSIDTADVSKNFAADVKVLNVTDSDNPTESSVDELDVGYVISFVLNSDDEISEIYLSATKSYTIANGLGDVSSTISTLTVGEVSFTLDDSRAETITVSAGSKVEIAVEFGTAPNDGDIIAIEGIDGATATGDGTKTEFAFDVTVTKNLTITDITATAP